MEKNDKKGKMETINENKLDRDINKMAVKFVNFKESVSKRIEQKTDMMQRVVARKDREIEEIKVKLIKSQADATSLLNIIMGLNDPKVVMKVEKALHRTNAEDQASG